MKYLTEAELCEQLRVSRNTTWELRKAGMPYRQVRGQIRYRIDEVERWLDENCVRNPLQESAAQDGGVQS